MLTAVGIVSDAFFLAGAGCLALCFFRAFGGRALKGAFKGFFKGSKAVLRKDKPFAGKDERDKSGGGKKGGLLLAAAGGACMAAALAAYCVWLRLGA